MGYQSTNERTNERTSEHENGRVGEVEVIEQQVLDALGVINAPFKLIPRVLVRYPAYHRPLLPTFRSGRRVVRVRRVVLGYVGDSAAERAADGGRGVGPLGQL